MFQERGEGDAGDAAYVMTDFSSGRMVTMSSASRILAMPRFVSAVSKACVVSVSSKLVTGDLVSSALVRLRSVEGPGRDGIRDGVRVDLRAAKRRQSKALRGGARASWAPG